MTSPRDIIEHYLGEEEAKIFAQFAWGDNYRSITFSDTVNAWNERHGKNLLLSQNGEPKKDIPKMIAVWKNAKVTEEIP